MSKELDNGSINVSLIFALASILKISPEKFVDEFGKQSINPKYMRDFSDMLAKKTIDLIKKS